ncbi:DUF3096 domain-containing protein [Candidatus Woesearchaeota archaeon]|nr:DUF3096 domain-containing protein [Candidatus Woesearchaeota archaeon]
MAKRYLSKRGLGYHLNHFWHKRNPIGFLVPRIFDSEHPGHCIGIIPNAQKMLGIFLVMPSLLAWVIGLYLIITGLLQLLDE